MDLLGDPHLSAPTIHVAGTNGKTSTARIIESILRAYGLTTGLYTSPALESITDRIALDGKPISPLRFADAYDEIKPMLELVDQQADSVNGPPVTMFEAVTAMAFTCFADAPVDVAIIETGMGGTWDATNVVEPMVTVITPIGLDHQEYLGETIDQIAGEKAGILKPDAAAVLAEQEPIAAAVLLEVCRDLGIHPVREYEDFRLSDRILAVGGQMITVSGVAGTYDELYLPLHGAHQARNAAVAIAAVEQFLGANPEKPLEIDLVRQGLAEATSPGRLERVRTSPTVFIDAAHNPHGVEAVVSTLAESFDFSRLVAVVAVLEGKDVTKMLAGLEPEFDAIVVTQNSSPRSMPVDDLAGLAMDVFSEDRVQVAEDLSTALELAVGMADDVAEWGSAAVVALGSVVTAADVRKLMYPKRLRVPRDARSLEELPPGPTEEDE